MRLDDGVDRIELAAALLRTSLVLTSCFPRRVFRHLFNR